MPLLSESQSGMTLNGAIPGGIELAGEVSRDRELSIQESESLPPVPMPPFIPLGGIDSVWRGMVPPPPFM